MLMNFYEMNATEKYDSSNDTCLELYGKEYWEATKSEQEIIDTLVWSRNV